jgi:sugar lactone lactonase YvrE
MSTSRTFRRVRTTLAVTAIVVAGVVLPGQAATAATPTPDSIALVSLPSGAGLQLVGWVGDANGQGVSGAKVRLTRSTRTGTTALGTLTTDADGYVTSTVATAPATRTTYRLLGGTDLVALATAGTGAVVPAAASTPAGFRSVSVPGYGDLEVDDVHAHLLVTTGGALRVYDLDGNLLKSVTVPGAPGDLALAPDQTTLYVAQENTGTVAVVDTATLAVVGRIKMPALSGAASGFVGLEVVGDQLVAGVGSYYGGMKLAVVPVGIPKDGSAVPYAGGPISGSTATGEVITTYNSSSSSATIWDVSTGAPVVRDDRFGQAAGVSFSGTDLDVSPDGRTILASVDGSPYLLNRTNADKLVHYPSPNYTASVAFSRDANIVATSASAYGDSLRLWDANTGTLLRKLSSSTYDYNGYVASDGLALSADSSRLYAVRANGSSDLSTAVLEVWDRPLTTCSASADATFEADGTVHVNGTLAEVGGGSVDGLNVKVRRTASSPVLAQADATLGQGAFSVTVPASAGVANGDSLLVQATPDLGQGCSTNATVTSRGPSATPSMVTYTAPGALAVFWSAITDPGSGPLTTQSVILLHYGEVVRWANGGPTAFVQGFEGLDPGDYQLLIVGWNEYGFGEVAERSVTIP